MINRILMKGGLAAASMLLGAIPAFCSTITPTISFSSTSDTYNGSGQLQTYSATISGFSGGYNGFSAGSLNDTISFSIVNNQDVFTIVAGTNNGFGVSSGTTLLQFTTAQSTGTANPSVVTYGAITAFTSLNSTFSNLLFGAPTLSSLTDGGSVNTGSSNTLSLTGTTPIAATPEPASFVLFGTGLIGAAFFGRRRIARQSV